MTTRSAVTNDSMQTELAIRPYTPVLAPVWNRTLARTKAPLFLFNRGYMDYHADRFEDCSALGWLDGEPVMLFPASIDRTTREVTSHAGLTFGGPLSVTSLRSGDAFQLIGAWLGWLRHQGARRVTVKMIPPSFTRYPADETAYALWRHGFGLVRRDFSSLLPLPVRLPFNDSKLEGVRKARRLGVAPTRPAIGDFHRLLSAVLHERHQVAPVHTAEELALLAERFPANMAVFGAEDGKSLLSAALVYDYGSVWHTQYLASSPAGRDKGALDLVVDELIRQAMERGVGAVSFGVSTVASGTDINEGLLWQKESYGARGIVHDFMGAPL